LCVFRIFIDHGSRWGDTVQALAQWQHPVASSEAQDVLHCVMRPASYRRIRMVIKITSTFPAFLLSLILLSPTTIDKDQVMVIIN
jgi:hypothetical protein